MDAGGEFLSTVASPVAPLLAGYLLTTLDASDTFIAIGIIMASTALLATLSRTLRHIPTHDG